MTNSPPSRNTASDNSLQGVLDLFRAKLLQNLDDMLPAKVLAYDRSTNRAQVQPLIVMVNTKNEQIARAQIASIPVLQIGGGGFVVSLPINTGDLGWIKASDRDISFFKKNYEQSAPNTQRKHSFSDAVFIPDSFMKDVVINSEDANNLVIQNLDGSVRIALWEDQVKITAPNIILDTPLVTCTTDLQVDGDINVDGAATMSTTLTVDGNITAETNIQINGNMTVNGAASIGGIPFATHKHTGVTTGAGNTGNPI